MESASDTNGQNIVTLPRSTSTQAQWELNIQDNKYSVLTNAFSTAGRALAVDGSNIELSSASSTGDYKFAVYRSGDETYTVFIASVTARILSRRIRHTMWY